MEPDRLTVAHKNEQIQKVCDGWKAENSQKSGIFQWTNFRK